MELFLQYPMYLNGIAIDKALGYIFAANRRAFPERRKKAVNDKEGKIKKKMKKMRKLKKLIRRRR